MVMEIYHCPQGHAICWHTETALKSISGRTSNNPFQRDYVVLKIFFFFFFFNFFWFFFFFFANKLRDNSGKILCTGNSFCTCMQANCYWLKEGKSWFLHCMNQLLMNTKELTKLQLWHMYKTGLVKYEQHWGGK